MMEIPTKNQLPTSGSAMDKKVKPKNHPKKLMALILTGLLTVLGVSYFSSASTNSDSLRVDMNKLIISSVTTGVFEDFIPIRGKVSPLKTVYLDAIEGGRIEQVLVEDGALLNKGDLIAVLSNTSLQLNVTRNEALATEQFNNMRTLELQLEQNRLAHKRELIELNYQIKRLTKQVAREKELLINNSISSIQLELSDDELEYYQLRKAVSLESQTTDANLQETQLSSIKTASAQLHRNLAYARKNLDSLNVRAPIGGKLSGLDIDEGQSIERGGRLGQINVPDDYKVTALIDEFYLNRIYSGQSAELERNNQSYQINVAKIYPRVVNGQFKVDLTFTEQQPQDIRLGQTLQLKLSLGDSSVTTLVQNDAFYQDSGGNWVFVVTKDGSSAIKRNVRLGRQNSQSIEVISGLEIGEQIISSSYANFVRMEQLELITE